MILRTGTRLAPYVVLDMLGAGGMGEVYRARDTKLGREVAIKILPAAFALDAERVARFRREAQVLASLNHPHIAQIYGLEQADGVQFLVMELVDGDTLDKRIARGPIAIDDALPIAKQITEALEAAHEKGIIHRDLKPANIALTNDGQVKVLDFGLAKPMEAGGPRDAGRPGDLDLANSPTITSPAMLSGVGVILGTAAYMSPEQAKGLPADHRSDIFSFGAVLFEMLTGRRAFDGETVSDVLASVLAREPDHTVLPRDITARLGEILKRCLEKNRRTRWQAIGDVRLELDAVAAEPRVVARMAAAVAPARLWWRRFAPALVSAMGAAAVTAVIAWSLRPLPAAVTRFSIPLPQGQAFSTVAMSAIGISPDGQSVAYAANRAIYVRRMDDAEPKLIAGTDGLQNVRMPVFSPDGESIAFFATLDTTIKRISIHGGAPVTVCRVDDTPWSLSWSDQTLLFSEGATGIFRVAASGGSPERIVQPRPGEVLKLGELLPGGTELLFTGADSPGINRWDRAQIVVESLDSHRRVGLVDGGMDPHYVRTGHLLYATSGVVFAVPFDTKRLKVTGAPAPVIEGVRRQVVGATTTAQFVISSTGTLAYIPGPASGSAADMRLGMIDRNGSVDLLKVPPGGYRTPRIAPDGTRVAVAQRMAMRASSGCTTCPGRHR